MNFPKASFSQKIIIKNSLKVFIIIFIFIAIEFICFRQTFVGIKAGKWSNLELIKTTITFILGVLFGVGGYYLRDKLEVFLDNIIRQIKNALKGNLGERKAIGRLQEILGSQYKIHRNFRIPNTKFDNDVIVIGPKGIILIEIKNIRGEFEFKGQETYKHYRCYGSECLCKLNEYKSPSKEVIRHSNALQNWLEVKGVKDIKIKRAVLLVGHSRIRKIEDPTVYIIPSLDGLAEFMDKSFNDNCFSHKFCDKLNQLLIKNK